MMHTLKAGDHVVCIDDVYAGTQQYFTYVPVLVGISCALAVARCPSRRYAVLHRHGVRHWSDVRVDLLGERWAVGPGCVHHPPVASALSTFPLHPSSLTHGG